jgi:hypothetical protein
MEVVVLGRHMARLVNPVLEQFTRGRRVADEGARMRPESSEEGELLAPHKDVDGVDLDESHPVDDLKSKSNLGTWAAI